MTATHAPDFIASHSDKTVRSILYACWVATFNTPEHHCGLRLAQTQVRCMLFACHDGRNAHRRDQIDSDTKHIVFKLKRWRRSNDERETVGSRVEATVAAERLARLRDRAEVTP